MQEIIIEGVQPITPEINRFGRPPIYPFVKLKEIGSSFWLPKEMKTYTALYMARRRQHLRGKARFRISEGQRDGCDGWRVQRIK